VEVLRWFALFMLSLLAIVLAMYWLTGQSFPWPRF
jgi:hypothetical protein